MIITDPDRVAEILTTIVEDPSVFDMFVSSPDELTEQLGLTDEELDALRGTDQLPRILNAVTATQQTQVTITTSTTTDVSDDGVRHTHEAPTYTTSTTTGTLYPSS